MRVARMPYLRPVKKTGIWQVRIQVPVRLRPIIGGDLIRNTGTRDRVQANAIAAPIIADFLGRIAAAERQLHEGSLRDQVFARLDIQARQRELRDEIRHAGYRIGLRQLKDATPDEIAQIAMDHRKAHPENQPPAPATFESILDLWELRRGRTLPAARRDAARPMARLAKFLGHSDAARVSESDLLRYLNESLLTADLHPKSVETAVNMLKALFTVASDNGLLPNGNPTKSPGFKLAKAYVQADPRRQRQPFTEAERARIIIEARKSSDPTIKWANLIAAFSGARLAEIVEAHTDDIEIAGTQQAVFKIRLDNRPETQRLKTDVSARDLPLHSSVMRDGFANYARSLPPGPLFPTLRLDKDGRLAKLASNKIMAWLRATCEITDPRKVFHSHRHSIETILTERGVDRAIRFKIIGHASSDIGDSVYNHASLADAIERIPDPTA
jgi:site-specific recombinase XerD